MIGRDIEAAVLADACKRVSAGQGREIVLVSGEAGIGKTTLATQVARAAFGAGAVVLLGRCQEDLGSPYGPFVEALSHYVSYAADDALRAGGAQGPWSPCPGPGPGRLETVTCLPEYTCGDRPFLCTLQPDAAELSRDMGCSESTSEWKGATVDACATPFGMPVDDPGSLVVVPESAAVSLLTGSRIR